MIKRGIDVKIIPSEMWLDPILM